MEKIPFHTTDWELVPVTRHAGETGMATWRTLQFATFRVRLVEYSKNYKADHWCEKGHVIYCLDGDMVSELSDGTCYGLSKGMSYQVSDGSSSHRTISEHGVKLLIVDGDFLK